MREENKRVHKLNIKISLSEKEELNKLIKSEQKSLSDIVRFALVETYGLEGFEPSYKNSIFTFKPKRKSIF
ncbi:ribbon-helix-helix protein, CopG family [Clostridium perfringens]|uniref:ribbon-helix-helix protein, CopG family n=1 Tax=Clostridium perfringens TaxID=1502 RepID=UPI000E47585B|nr:ribbon-helix-helix protein, CopG family [Clostridium perfringens]MCC2765237.1 ribbon-helix-helix protein, CopG family [Clostridium perfringens]MCG4542249.1 ribbon-helix-helix protein, CopG family [Clostridium perfringens]MCG4544896.1 ribbon-helix-helix protein, CopG family [Clostridium perfringens]MCG4553551.1 ribbon-helix-helix protein, CopG family [Clostridium perfringens]MCG4556982.1 ribbon-helix-helix protein, CopG family [Clostridium perfringens]